MTPEVVPDPGTWPKALFRRSVLKQRKLAELVAMLGPTAHLRCLDLGSDNGVISLLLRERGGSWASGDLTGRPWLRSEASLPRTSTSSREAASRFRMRRSTWSRSWTCSST